MRYRVINIINLEEDVMADSDKNWDDVPSLDGLSMDWDYEPENPMGKRAYSRLSSKELRFLSQKNEIPVKIATNKRQFKGLLLDVSQGGASIQIEMKELRESQLIKVGFFLGTQKIISKAKIRNIRESENGNTILGIEFVGLEENTDEFISRLYSSVKIKDWYTV